MPSAAGDTSLSKSELEVALAISERKGNFKSAAVRQKLTGTLSRSKSETRLDALGAQDSGSPRGSWRLLRHTSNDSSHASYAHVDSPKLAGQSLVRNKSAEDMSVLRRGGMMAQRMALLDKIDSATRPRLAQGEPRSLLSKSGRGTEGATKQVEMLEATMQGEFSTVSSVDTDDRRHSGRNTLPSSDEHHEAGSVSVSQWIGLEKEEGGLLTELDLSRAIDEMVNKSGEALKWKGADLWVF